MAFPSAGQALMTTGNLFYALGAFYFDWEDTHVLNPAWPPHAKFHNGQTMSIGALLAALAMFLLYRPYSSKSARQDGLLIAALVGSLYAVSGLSAILYPGTDWTDPEFYDRFTNGDPGQRWIFGSVLVFNWGGFLLERARLGKVKAA